MKEQTAERLESMTDVHLHLLFDSVASEIKRRNPKRARAMAKELVLLMCEPVSSAEPFPHMESA